MIRTIRPLDQPDPALERVAKANGFLSLPKTPSMNSFLLYFTNRSSLEASDIFEKGSLVLGTADSRTFS